MRFDQHTFERRTLLRALSLLPFSSFSRTSSRFVLAQAQARALPFLGRQRLEYDKHVGQGLDGRLAFDLARLKDQKLVVTNQDFFVRTHFPDGLEARRGNLDDWIVLCPMACMIVA